MKYKVDDIIPYLEGVKASSGGNYTAKCPAHDDKNNSFSIGSDAEGFAICNCFAGCSQADIWDAIYKIIGKPEADKPEKVKTNKRTKNKVVAEYEYKDADGATVDVKRRYDNKAFSWKRGTAKRADVLPLYNLEDILTAVDVFAVEGEKDVNTLKALGYPATSTKDGFTSENMHYFEGKNLFVIEDNDAPGRKTAKKAATLAKSSAAHVKIIDLAAYFPALPVKGDISDFVEMKGSVEDLKTYITTLPEFIPDDNETEDEKHPHAAIYENIEHYFVNKKGQIVYTNGDNSLPVCYGSLAIIEEIRKNDGEGSALFFKVQGVTEGGRVLPSVLVKASELSGFNWLPDAYGSEIVTAPAQSAKQKLAAAVLMTGRQAIKKTIHTATGYLMNDGAPVAYIHAGGSLNGSDTLEAEINQNLKQYVMTGASSSASEMKEAARASLQLLTAHAPGVVYPLFSFVYLAPLLPVVSSVVGDTGFCVYLQGKTQSGKSTLAALALSHFGRFDAMTPPTSFNSTANYINELAFMLKDCILWVDDFHPQGTKREADKQAQIFQNIARAAGDHSQRGRLTSSAKLQAMHRPRCLFLATGEDVPQIGQSGIARLFTLQVSKTREDITALRKNARDGVLSRAMSDYITFIILHYADVVAQFGALYAKASDKAIKAYSENRLASQAALLYTAALLYLSYCVGNGILTEDTGKAYAAKFEKYIFKAAEKINAELFETDPVQMFIKDLKGIISAGRRYIVDLEAKDATGYYQPQALGAKGDVIGWKDSHFYYMDPVETFASVAEDYKKQGVYFSMDPRTLNRELLEAGYIIGSRLKDPTYQKRINGKNTRVLKFARAKLEDAEAEGGGL